jgi:predicted  nucleic acid-binding Zn-ribbon protein
MRLQTEIAELKHLETENFQIQKEVGRIQGEKNDLEYQIKSLKVQIQDLKSQISNPQRVSDPIISDRELRELKHQLDLKDERISNLLAKLDSIE